MTKAATPPAYRKGVKELQGLDFVLPHHEHGLQNHGVL
jgi:hypothetical protein